MRAFLGIRYNSLLYKENLKMNIVCLKYSDVLCNKIADW